MGFNKQKHAFAKITKLYQNHCFHYCVAYRVTKCKKTHLYGGSLVLPAEVDTFETMLDETYAKEFQKIPLADKTV
jgi:hypothetical protein